MNSENNKYLWEALADDVNARMGVDGNDFHQKLIRPATLRLLNLQPNEHIIDIACGNGIFARYLAAHDVDVVAFDFSPKLLAHAKDRCADYLDHISFSVADATNYDQLLSLGEGKPFDKAVANMAVMGFPQIEPLFRAVYEMLKSNGVFVFSAVHPCFQTPGRGFTEDSSGLITYNYIESKQYAYQILTTTDKYAYHWHRPLQELLGVAFNAGLVMDGIEEPVYGKGECTHAVWEKVPLPIVLRVRKLIK
jgi:ubiquinone/menaquinone biosynthesis C-methylase UbiE